MKLLRLLTFPPALLLIANLASADAITGRVVDASGVGVAGVDIDFVKLGGGGGNPHELNDGTDANGNFLTTVDPGVYEVRFYAPPPPTTTLLTGIVSPVVISGTVNMGTITLISGASVQGTAKTPANVPIGGIKINIFNAATGTQYWIKNGTTDAFGQFNVTMPKNTDLRIEYLTNGVIGQVVVPRQVFGTVPVSVNLGTLTFQNGFHLTGIVRRSTGTPVVGADTDTTDVNTGATFFTPSDNTNSLGAFDVVLPAGTFDFDVIRPAGQNLVGVGFNNLVISGPTDLGILTMRTGVFLSGTIRDRAGNPVNAADVNVYEVATGQSLPLGADNANAAGFYSVVVPTGLLDVAFTPPGNNHGFGRQWHLGLNVTTNTTLNGKVGELVRAHQGPQAATTPPVLPFGAGTRGTGGSVPHIGGMEIPGGIAFQLNGGRPDTVAQLWLGFGEEPLSPQSEVHVVRPLVRLPVTLDAEGAARLELPLVSGLAGRTVFAQFAVLDPQAENGRALSHVVAVKAPR